jgi:hypothetical protein
MPKMFYMPYAHVLLCAFYLSRSMIICYFFDSFYQKKKRVMPTFPYTLPLLIALLTII